MQAYTEDLPTTEPGPVLPRNEAGGFQSATILAVLLMQMALLGLGVMLYIVKSDTASASQQAKDDSEGGGTSDDEGTQGGGKKPASPLRAADLAELRKRSKELSQTADDLNAQVEAAKEAVGKLTAAEGTLATVRRNSEQAATKLTSVESSLKSIKDLTTQDVGDLKANSDTIAKSLVRLETLVSRASTWDAVEADVIVIACASAAQPFKPFLPAYRTAIYNNPARSWFKNHRVGLWIAQGFYLNPVLPIDLAPEKIAAKWGDFEEKLGTTDKMVATETTKLGEVVIKQFAPNRLSLTRFVLVVPADAIPPAEGAWGNAKVDVVLVAAEHDSPVTSLAEWVNFCSGRGLLSVLRPPAPTPPAPGANLGTKATESGNDPKKTVTGGQVALQEKNKAVADAAKPAGPPKILVEQLGRELIRLTLPAPSDSRP